MEWKGSIFRNTYTRAGRQIQLKGWSAKIQHRGTRRTFSLAAKSQASARIEAQAIYQTIVTQGWDAVGTPSGRHHPRAGTAPASEMSWPRTDVRHWKQRLLHRSRSLGAHSQTGVELSVRIDHAGHGRYFPLGTANHDAAAARAREIYQTIVRDGWDQARRIHVCEVTVALHWASDPLAWTYATFHTSVTGTGERVVPGAGPKTPAARVVLIEPDPTIRRALAARIDGRDGFVCTESHETADAALAAMARRPPHLVLANHLLPHLASEGLADSVRRVSAESFSLYYSIHEDSDQLFKATPGGASGYLLKRTTVDRLFEPIADVPASARFTTEAVAVQMRRYFQKVLQHLSASDSGGDMARLTHREHEILNLLSRGCVDKEIADNLRISIWTVHGHLKRIYDKLGVHTRTEAAIKYLQK